MDAQPFVVQRAGVNLQVLTADHALDLLRRGGARLVAGDRDVVMRLALAEAARLRAALREVRS